MVDIKKLSQVALEAEQLNEQHYGAIEAARRIADSPVMQAIKDLQEKSEVSRVLEGIKHNESLIRAAQGPLEELRLAGVFDHTSDLYEQYLPVQHMIDTFNARFTLPDVPSTVMLMQEFQQSPAIEAMARYSTRTDDIQRAMEAMQTPWLDAQETMQSVTSFVELQGIGRMLESMPAFDNAVCAALRTDLGDWRSKHTWPEIMLTDMAAREASYVELGFDPSLTEFPPLAFKESTEIAGLRREPPPLVATYGEPVPCSRHDDDEKALILTNEAHDWLLRLESQLRKFIDDRMTEVFGPDWPKHQLPNGVYEQWMVKREKAVKEGRQSFPLIAYADFTDYKLVICKKDNWQQVFSSYFARPENVRESFHRLYPIRLDTMHARPITQDDQLLLYVEVKRLLSVIPS